MTTYCRYLLVGAITMTLASLVSVRADTTPQITVQPVPRTSLEGGSVTFSVTAIGGSLVYQWKHGSTLLPDETNSVLVLNNVTYDHSGTYSVSVGNGAGVAFSDKATLTVVSRAVWAWGNIIDRVPPAGMANVVAVAAGALQPLALHANGTLTAWGPVPFPGFPALPPGLVNVINVSAGTQADVVIRDDGTIVGWARGDIDVMNGAYDWTNMAAVAASGSDFFVALRKDGTIATSGDPWINPPPAVPPGLSNVVDIAAGAGHFLTLLADGKVASWGNQTYVPAGLEGIVAVSAGSGHNLALRSDGTPVAWGDNTYGQTDVPPSLSNNVVAIACGSTHCLALTRNGDVVAWGDNAAGQTNVPFYVHGVGAISAGPVADYSLAAPGEGPPFITSRLTDRTWAPDSAPNMVFFRVQATGQRPLSYQWRLNGADLPGETNAVLQVSNPINKQGDYTVVVTNSQGSATIPPARLLIGVPRGPIQIALGNDLVWTTGGAANWFTQSVQSRDGLAQQSGAVGDTQQSWIETSVTGPTPLSFWWKVSSEAGYDYLEFYIDGLLQSGRISGEVPWKEQNYTIPAGTHTLRWRYVKDGADKAGQDAGWLDQVSVAPMVTLTCDGTAGATYNVLTSTNATLPLSDWTLAGAATETAPGKFKYTDPQPASSGQRFYRFLSP